MSARVVFLAEMHGTNEAPAAALALARSLMREGSKVIIAPEIPADEQRFLDSPKEPLASIAKREFWAGATLEGRQVHDGRSSRAVFDVINQIKDMRASGQLQTAAAVASQ